MSITQKDKLLWIENNLSFDDYNLVEIRNEIIYSAFYSNNIKRWGSYQKALENMLQGLPWWNTCPFSNYDILQLRDEWGYKTSDDAWTERWYWSALSSLLIQYFKKQNLPLF